MANSLGVSAVISVVLMLMIAIALSSTAYLYISGYFSGTVSQSFMMVYSYNDTITIRNNGDTPIESITVSVDGNPVDIEVSTGAPETIGQELIGHWKFDEGLGDTTYDSSGYGNDGILENSTHGPQWRSGSDCKYGGCLEFDGEGDYVWISSIPQIPPNPDNGPISLGVWFKTSTMPLEYSRFFTDSWIEIGLLIRTNGYLRGKVYSTTDSLSTVTDDEWHHALLIYDYNNLIFHLYLDGEYQNSASVTIGTGFEDTPFGIGADPKGSGPATNFFNGFIDEVRIYNRVISDTEIEFLAKGGVSAGVVPAGQIANVKLLTSLQVGTNTVRLCTPTMCQTSYLTIT